MIPHKPSEPTNGVSKRHLSASDWRSYLTLFNHNRSFFRFWLASLISNLGNWLNYIAIFVMLNKLGGSSVAISWFLIAKFIPTTILAPAAGVIADRFSRRKIMIFCDLARVLVVLAFLLVNSPSLVWLVFVLALAQESLRSFHDPARQALLPNICHKDELHLANAISGATWSIMLAIGAGLGGLISNLWGWETTIIINALTFAISALIINSIKVAEFSLVKRKKSGGFLEYSGFNDLAAAVSYLRENRSVARLLLVKCGWGLSGGILVMLAVFGEQIFSVGGQGGASGILYSVRGIGAAVGPIIAWRLFGEGDRDMYRSISIAFFAGALFYFGLSISPTLFWASIFAMFGHLAGSVQWVFSTTLIQKKTDDHYRGRIFAAEMALVTLSLSVSIYLTGLALDSGIDPRLVTAVLASVFILPGSVWTAYYMTMREKK